MARQTIVTCDRCGTVITHQPRAPWEPDLCPIHLAEWRKATAVCQVYVGKPSKLRVYL